MLDEYKSAYTLNEHFGKINSIGVNCKPKASKHTGSFTFEIFKIFVKIINGSYRVFRAMGKTNLRKKPEAESPCQITFNIDFLPEILLLNFLRFTTFNVATIHLQITKLILHCYVIKTAVVNVLKNPQKTQSIKLKSKYWCKLLSKANQITLQNLIHIGPTVYCTNRPATNRPVVCLFKLSVRTTAFTQNLYCNSRGGGDQ